MQIKHPRAGAAILAAAVSAVGIGASPLTAHATDTIPFACPSAPTAAAGGVGSSFQNNFVQAAIAGYAARCTGAAAITYGTGGSGKGVAAILDRSATAQFGGTDIPYSDTTLGQNWLQLQLGVDSNANPPVTGLASPLATIPVALGAVAVAYTLPATCSIPAGTTLETSGATLAAIWAGTITDWNAVPGVTCTVGTPAPIHPQVRSASSGTTFAFKDYLTKKDPVDYAQHRNSLVDWPNSAAVTQCGPNNSNMVTCAQVAGNIVYVDFSDATARPLTHTQLDNAQGLYLDPGSPGVCTEAASTGNTPPSALADWSNVTITDGPTGYGDCTYTYQLVLVNSVAAHSNPTTQVSSETAAQAANVNAFVAYEVSDAGQALAPANNYEKLPPAVQAIAQVGAASLTTN